MLEYLMFGGVIANATLTLYVLHKTRRTHLATFDLRDELTQLRRRYLIDLHQQLQELSRLNSALRLKEALPATRGWAASPDFLRLLMDHIHAEMPRTVIELGSGTSTIVVARSLQLQGRGHLYSYDHDPDFAEETRANLRRYELSEWATVIDAPLTSCTVADRSWRWYNLQLPLDRVIDLLVIDGPPEATGPMARYPAGPILFPRLAEGAAVFLDDADRDDERKAVEDWMARFPNLTVERPRAEKGCAILRQPTADSKRASERQQEAVPS